jgi:hypothetical protein
MLSRCGLLCFVLAVSNLSAKPVARVELGYLQTGARVTLVRSPTGEWGIEISGGAGLRISQSQPATLEVFRKDNDIHQVAAGYKTVRKSESGIDALAEIKYDNVLFRVQDHWTLSGAVLAVHRKVDVVGNAAGGSTQQSPFRLRRRSDGLTLATWLRALCMATQPTTVTVPPAEL